MTIRLTEEQHCAITAHNGLPIDVVDPTTNLAYVLVPADQYQRVRQLLERSPDASPQHAEEEFTVAPGILRSQEAFWRDLPELLKNKKYRGKLVCYHGDERIGIAKSELELIKECLRRGLARADYDILFIEPMSVPPWEPEEMEPLGPWHLE